MDGTAISLSFDGEGGGVDEEGSMIRVWKGGSETFMFETMQAITAIRVHKVGGGGGRGFNTVVQGGRQKREA